MKHLILLTSIFLILLTACEELQVESRDYPVVDTYSAKNINNTGVTIEGEVLKLGISPITDHGFVYDMQSKLFLNQANQVTLGPLPSASKFNGRATSNLVPNKKYYARSYVITEDNHVVYGPLISFISKGGTLPKITSFEPQSGSADEIIQINGEGFSYGLGKNSVSFGSYNAQVVDATDTWIKCKVPFFAPPGQYTIRVTLESGTVTSVTTFTVE
jgi:hypothetical protein